MGGFGNFYKGDKKKKRQKTNANANTVSNRPVFVVPKRIEKKKKEW
ncbi:MAG TPA: hypothetical protein VGT05_00965 [Patescibacteria group bacterium]|nr:hypothetical protein [Patescibacteria group bacterium]